MLRSVWRQMYLMRTEGAGRSRQTAAVGLGIFIGCLPFYGFHLLMAFAAGWLLGLNRLKVYLAANISNPLFAPFLIFAEVQTGAFVRRGATLPLTVEALKSVDPWTFGGDLLIGALVVGTVLASIGAATTYAMARTRDAFLSVLVERAADRYAGQSLVAWEFARGKIYRDPIYQTIVRDDLLPPSGTLVDIGCGQGLMLALLAEAAAMDSRAWPHDWNAPPVFERLIGIELRPRVARLASAALGSDAVIITADALVAPIETCSAVLILDVLHMMSADDQSRLIAQLATRLAPDAVMLVREADAGSGWRHAIVRSVNWLQAARQGRWRQPFCFRTRAEWAEFFSSRGFLVEESHQRGGARLGNVLFRLRRR